MSLKKFNHSFIILLTIFNLIMVGWHNIANAEANGAYIYFQDTVIRNDSQIDSARIKQDSINNLPYTPSRHPTFRPKDRFGDPFSNFISPSPLLLKDPASFSLDVEMDTGNNYIIYEKIGDLNYRPTTSMTFDEFNDYQTRKVLKDYWKMRSAGLDGESAVSGRRLLPPIFVSPVFDKIFGGSYVELTPRGFVTLNFGGKWQRIDNPSIPIRQQRNGGFEFDQQISMNVVGKVGEKLAITANFDNNNSFDFENNLKVEYTGFEEDILKKLEIGNISLPLNNSLISGAQNLFGIKSQMQFGKLFVTSVASTQRGKTESIEISSGGVQSRDFEIRASDYDENRHFFLGHFFRDHYEEWHSRIPQISSGVNVTRVEVYVLNRNANTQSLRNVVGLVDLGEGRRVIIGDNNIPRDAIQPYPADRNQPASNNANALFSNITSSQINRDAVQVDEDLKNKLGLKSSTDFEIVTSSRLLQESEYTINAQLGYISLFRKLQNDEVLAVAYEYTHNGRPHKVGELREDYASRPEDEVIFLKLLKTRETLRRDSRNRVNPTFDLMMKNIYNLNANQVNREGFQFRIIYRDDRTGIDNPSLHEGILTKDIPLVELLELDRLNPNNDPPGDGNFDFVDNVTIKRENGLVLFPVLEPFGDHLRKIFEVNNEQVLIQKFVYDTLYGTTRSDAILVTEKNKFFMVGSLQAGSSSEIILPGINIAEGSVRVLSGNTALTEGVDFTVDYNFGRVTIINEGVINSGNRLSITYEKADLFNFQSRTLLGSRFDYQHNEDINFGATILYHNERPLISRVSIGDEPTRNTKYGFDVNVRKESRMLTKIVDALPFLQTKAPSTIAFSGEFAQLLPGTSNIVDGEGTSYIDDFESTVTPFNLGNNYLSWKLASTPQTSDNRFDPSMNTRNDLSFGYKRAKIAWYLIDNVFYRSGGRAKPSNLDDNDLSNHYIRAVPPQEIFLQKNREVVNTNEPIFDIAYYPSERGHYNYNPQFDNSNSRSNWGGITRAITSEVDFDKINIEYIQFWLLDPFIGGENGKVLDGVQNVNNTTGGKLIFNIGNISEDVLKDGRHAFENGLPPDGSIADVDVTAWGRVTQQQFLNNAFDNSSGSRENQDVGLDGLKNADEKLLFTDLSNLPDPSSDDFEYYLGSRHDEQDNKVLERYKGFNGMENNSPILTNNSLPFTPSGSTIPENEDLNRDNTLSDLEEYYEYSIDLNSGSFEVGQNHIVDKVTNLAGVNGTLQNGTSEQVTWYLFRIPVRKFDNKFGNISGFKSIKYVRTYLTDWSQPVVLRFANFQLMGSQWRRFKDDLEKRRFDTPPETDFTDFTVSVVNIEENSSGNDFRAPYVLPPGFKRDRDNTSAIERRLNEQSLQMCVEDLEDEDARAVFKNVEIDLINYGRIKMFIHAESDDASDDELTGFIRLGKDNTENYYEIELPLKITPFNLTSGGDQLRRDVWPLENEIDIPLDFLFQIKSRRNGRRNQDELLLRYTETFTDQFRSYRVSIVGNPKLSQVKTLMIGIRNPDSADKSSKSACIWANELRVTDFDKTAGWAANASLNVQLADLGSISSSARFTTYGFGRIQSKISDRTRENSLEYDVAANIALDKLLPKNTGLQIPMYMSFQKSVITPQFDPKSDDIPLDDVLASLNDEKQEKDYKKIVQTQTTRKSINFTNVKKVKINPDAKKHIYDIENFSFTYAYSEINHSEFNIASRNQKNYKGAVNYNYGFDGFNIEPFKKLKFLDGSYLALLKDFNFNPLPNSFSFRADLDRVFTRTQYRNENLGIKGIAPNFEKFFTFNRTYGMRWNLTKNLSLDYSARANSIIDEPDGDIGKEEREVIWDNLKDLGRMKNYNQDISANYRVPLDKIPLVDWINTDLRYAVGYRWTAGALNQQDSLGNLIQNNRDRTLTGKFDLVKLYNKSKFLKEVNTPRRPTTTRPGQRPTQTPDTTRTRPNNGFIKGIMRTIMTLRSVNFTYTVGEGTLLPGFLPSPSYFGLDSAFNAPGAAFIFGSQSPDIKETAARNGWLASGSTLTNPFSQMQSIDISLRASLEPFKDFKIQLDAKKRETSTFQEIFRFDAGFNEFRSLNPTRSGSYSISFNTIKTAFIPDNSDNTSPVFEDYVQNRGIIQQRLNGLNSAGEYQLNSQDVLIPAFIAAYSGRDATTMNLSPFPKTPIPNWRIDYNGLGKLSGLSDIFSSITITHSYSSTYNINSFTNSLLYADGIGLNNSIENYPIASLKNDNGDLVPVFVINQVQISERFSPLIGINVRTKSRLTARLEYKTERNLTLNLSNTQITELNSKDVSFDLGFTKANFKIPFRIQGRTVALKNDLTFRVNFTIRDTKTIQRKIDEQNTITRGNLNFQLRPNVSYVLNQRLNLQFFFERNINEPKVSNSFRRSTTSAGIQIRFSLTQ